MDEALLTNIMHFIGDIEWAWNTRNATALCAMYTDDADIIHALGAARGRRDIDHLYQTICRNGERMGYVNALKLKPEFRSWTPDGRCMLGISLFSGFLSPNLTEVRPVKTTLLLRIFDTGEMRIVRDVECL